MKRILQDVHCTGDSVFGKYQQSVFQGNKQRNRPESEWVHMENTHGGIIDRELFQQVQSKIQEYTETYKKKHQQNNGAIRNHNFYTGKDMVRRLWQPHDVVQRKKWHILLYLRS